MIKAVRQRALLDHLQHCQVATTDELTAFLGVSAATVRRDLDELVATGQVERIFGGARLIQPAEKVDDPFDDVLMRNTPAKVRIAELVAQQINDGETVFLEAGTTTYQVAVAVAERNLTIVTNSIRIADLLAPQPSLEIIMLGGQLNREYRCTQGQAAIAELTNLMIDVTVLGCSGIGENGIVRDTDPRECELKRIASSHAGRCLVVAPHDKFPGLGAYSALPLSEVDLVITDAPLPQGFPPMMTKVVHP